MLIPSILAKVLEVDHMIAVLRNLSHRKGNTNGSVPI